MPNLTLNVLDRSGHTVVTETEEIQDTVTQKLREEGHMLFAQFVNSIGEETKEHLHDFEDVNSLDVGDVDEEVDLFLVPPMVGG